MVVRVLSVATGSPALADDIWSMCNCIHQEIFTRTQPVVHVRNDDRILNQIRSFLHFGILYSFIMKSKDKFSLRLQKANNALSA